MSHIRQFLGKVSIVILLCFVVLLFMFASLDGKYSVHSSEYTEYTIVGLFPLSGGMSTYAESNVASANLAVADINDWLADEDKAWRLKLEIEDTELNHEIALGLMQHWHEEEGVDFFVGPMISGEAEACLDYANDNDILFISPSSNMPVLAIDDWFFRFVVDMSFQDRVNAALIDDTGVKELVFTWPGHDWGDSYQVGIASAVADLNPTITIHDSDQFRYDPEKSDYGDEVESLNNYITDLVNQGVDPEEIGLVCIGADYEVAALLAEADNYSQLKDIMWFGTEMNGLSEDLLSHPVAAEFAADVGFIFPLQRRDLVLPEESYYDYVKEHVKAEIGREPDDYAYVTNDIISVLSLSFDEHGYNSAAVKETLPEVTDQYTKVYGASGHIVLNEYGDRAYADFALWEVNNQLEWEDVGYYEGISESIYWFAEPPETGPFSVGLYDPSDGVFHPQAGSPFRFGPRNSEWLAIAGDWEGRDTCNVGLYDPSDGVFHLQGPDPFRFGPRTSSWLPLAGDWTGNGTTGVGLYDPSDGVFHLQGPDPFRFGPRNSDWLPVAGDWNNDGTFTVGLYDPSDGVFHLQDIEPFRFGPRASSWLPVAGDWNGDGTCGVGLYDPADGVIHLEEMTPYRFGPRESSWQPIAGSW